MTLYAYLLQQLRDAGRIELRHEHDGRWSSGTFDSVRELVDEIDRRAGRGNLYHSLNAANLPAMPMGSAPWCDSDVHTVVRLLFDFDPVRPAGTPSTDDELARAVDRRDHFVLALGSLGWPEPALAISGNGAHALFRCRLRATPELAAALADMYRHWKREWSDELVAFDPTVRNPGRIARLYGSQNRKGASTPDRPHRASQIAIPARWRGVSPELVARAADAARRAAPPRSAARPIPAQVGGSGDFATLDVVEWFAAHGAFKRSVAADVFAVHCPWADEHSVDHGPMASDTVIFAAKPPRLWPRFYCHHGHCDGRTIADVMRLWGDADRYCTSPYRRTA